MNIKRKVFSMILAGMMSVIILAGSSVPVFAESYTTTVDISPNSNVWGAVRTYSQKNYEVKVTPKKWNDSQLSKRTRIAIREKSTSGKILAQGYLSMPGLNATWSKKFTGVGKGKMSFQFCSYTETPRQPLAGFYANPVVLRSYN